VIDVEVKINQEVWLGKRCFDDLEQPGIKRQFIPVKGLA
jgi:hypothetical protein